MSDDLNQLSGTSCNRRSRRLSGQKPEVSLLDAQKAADSPRVNARGRRVNGAGLDEAEERTTAVQVHESIPEEEEMEQGGEVVEEEQGGMMEGDLAVAPESKSKRETGQSSRPKSAQSSIPRGKCKSGRFWKSERDRFKSVIKSKGLKQSYLSRKRQKEERKRAMAMEEAMKEEKRAKMEDLKRRREENKKKREENERKAEVVQTVSSTVERG